MILSYPRLSPFTQHILFEKKCNKFDFHITFENLNKSKKKTPIQIVLTKKVTTCSSL
jgi:hypothetical protein